MTAIITALIIGGMVGILIGRVTGDQNLMDAVEDARDRADAAEHRLALARHVPWLVRSKPSPRGWAPTRKNTGGRLT